MNMREDENNFFFDLTVLFCNPSLRYFAHLSPIEFFASLRYAWYDNKWERWI